MVEDDGEEEVITDVLVEVEETEVTDVIDVVEDIELEDEVDVIVELVVVVVDLVVET